MHTSVIVLSNNLYKVMLNNVPLAFIGVSASKSISV